MVRKPDIQYVHEFYVHGSEARVIELKPRRRAPKTELPKTAPDKTIRIGVDPVALCGIVVAVAMLVMLAVGFTQYIEVCNRNQAAMNQVIELQNRNIEKQMKYEAGYVLSDIEQKAASLGLIPVAEAEVILINPVVPVREAEPTVWDNIVWFMDGLFA